MATTGSKMAGKVKSLKIEKYGIAALLTFLRSGVDVNIDHVLTFWGPTGVFRVIKGKTEDGNYALHVNLARVEKEYYGQEALIPFYWDAKQEGREPSVEDAVETFRSTYVRYGNQKAD